MKAKKSLGQHFLHDQYAIQQICHAMPPGATAIEIGPGPGALTERLIERASALTVIELDDRFASMWQERAVNTPHLHVVQGSVLDCLPECIAGSSPDWIIGNLPYNISGPLTAMLASCNVQGGMVLMYQREVGQRICATSGSKVYGGLSVLVRHHYDVSRLMTLAPGAFSPPPKVHSVVLQLRPHHRQPLCTFHMLQKIVRIGFAHRRKTIANNFRGMLDQSFWASIHINPKLRPEQIDYSGWEAMAASPMVFDALQKEPTQ
ncbi:MAG: 16S rRNA (adenine(1518)-N(6)/adenine(1519)-N(6))-dimethyltransferase RsmA [Mariprofundaceae bacterium]